MKKVIEMVKGNKLIFGMILACSLLGIGAAEIVNNQTIAGILKVDSIQKYANANGVYIESVKFLSNTIGAPTNRPTIYSGNFNVNGTVTGLTKADVALNNVPNTDCTNASNINNGTLPKAQLPTYTAHRAAYFNASSALTESDVSDTELNYLLGTTSGIQSQINSKQATITASGILKGNGAGSISAASAGSDYATATTGTNAQLLANNGSGGFSNVTVGTNLTLTEGTLSASGGGGLSLSQAKTTDYSVTSDDANKLTYLSNAASANSVFSLLAAASASNKNFTFNNLSSYLLTIRVAGQTTILSGGTASSSTGTAANAFDGDTGTSCDFSAQTGTLTYDMGAGVTKAFNRVRFYCDGNNGSVLSGSVQVSNDNFTTTITLKSFAETAFASAAYYNLYFQNDVGYRYIRLNIVTTKGGSNAKVFEMQAFDQSLGAGRSEYSLTKGETVNVFCDGTSFYIY